LREGLHENVNNYHELVISVLGKFSDCGITVPQLYARIDNRQGGPGEFFEEDNTMATQPKRVDYYTVKWRGPDQYPEGHKYREECKQYNYRRFHEKDFKPSQLSAATSLAKKLAATDGVSDVELRPVEVVGMDIGFPMNFLGDRIAF
jgi:hypothetical protein